jgi:hypothetical protein
VDLETVGKRIKESDEAMAWSGLQKKDKGVRRSEAKDSTKSHSFQIKPPEKERQRCRERIQPGKTQ